MSVLRTEAGRVAAVVWKDMTAERRSKATLNAVAFLAGVMLLMFGFAFGADPAAFEGGAAGMLWLTVLFSGVLAFNRSYDRELEGGALEILLLYPGDARAIFLGKLIANLIFVLLVEAVLVPAAIVLYGLPVGAAPLALIGVLLLGTFGFVTLGTFYASMASRLRAREVLLPLLLFPMLVPLLLASVEATNALLTGDVMGHAAQWIRVVIVFDVVFFTVAFYTFAQVIDE
jgi:heme exporter protein B